MLPPRMPLTADESALLAYLIESQRVPLDVVLAAVHRSAEHGFGVVRELIDGGYVSDERLRRYQTAAGVVGPHDTVPDLAAERDALDAMQATRPSPPVTRPQDQSNATRPAVPANGAGELAPLGPTTRVVPFDELPDASAGTAPDERAHRDAAIAATVRRSTDPEVSAPADPKASVADPKASAPADPRASAPADPKASAPADPKASVTADPDATVPSDRASSSGIEVPLDRASKPVSPSGRSGSERYQLLGEIARGGMGRIIKARDTEIGRIVAMKVLLRGVKAPENDIRRFWMEVQATGQLEHPSIIPIHDVGRLPTGELFYVMKMLSGRTLATVLAGLKRGDPVVSEEFRPMNMLTVFQKIVFAVAFAHARKVIHRDIKPANIMIGRYGEAMLLDWGLAKLAGTDETSIAPDLPRVRVDEKVSGADTAHGTITGTPQYMSPEATEGVPGRINEKSDVYSLGVVLYEILTYDPPFPDLGFMPTIMKVRSGDFTPPRVKAPDRNISIELEELCLAALALDPDQRPSAAELAADLGRILEGTRERERREKEARARVREGRESVERWKLLKAELQAVRVEARQLAKSVSPWAEVAAKEPIWQLEDHASALEIDAITAFEESEAAFQQALGDVPDDREARSSLAALYYARFCDSEKARDAAGQNYFSSLVTRYDEGVWAKVLAGDGRLTVSVSGEADDASLSLAVFEDVDRHLTPRHRQQLGSPPIGPKSVALGSYLLTIERPDARPIVRPVHIGRMESVNVDVRVRSDAEIGESFVLVPAGPCVLGGDEKAHGCMDRRIVHVGELAVARYPVTCGDYLEFLDDVARTDRAAAEMHVPRVGRDEGHYWNWDDDRRCFTLPSEQLGRLSWDLAYPIFGVSYEDALAYIAWKAAHTGEQLRLPHEDEWEKAARGVDGRFFPWGDHFDPTFCKMKDSRDVPYPTPEPVGAFEADCSPYGIRDMAGGVRELCWTTEDGEVRPVMRGGCWHDTGLFCRVAFRHVTKADFVNTGLGFRLVKDLEGDPP